MKKYLIILILSIIFMVLLNSCQLVSLLLNQTGSISMNHDLTSFDSFTYNQAYFGVKSNSFSLGDSLIISYIGTGEYFTNRFYIKKINEYSYDGYQRIYDSNDINSEISLDTNFYFTDHPSYYIPVFEKISENIFNFYYLDSSYALNKKTYNLKYDYPNYKYIFEKLGESVSPTDSMLSSYPYHNAILYDLKKSNNIGYITLYNNSCYLKLFDKDDLTIQEKYLFDSDYNMSVNNPATIVEYGYKKFYAATVAQNIIDNKYYLLIFKVDMENNSAERIYSSYIDAKIANLASIKLIYNESKGKLYIAWSYLEDNKNYIAISEYVNNTVLDRIRIDCSKETTATPINVENIDIKIASLDNINLSNIYITYSISTPSSNNIYGFGIIKTNNFSDSGWSFLSKTTLNTNYQIYFSNISNSNDFIIDVSSYDLVNLDQIYYYTLLIN